MPTYCKQCKACKKGFLMRLILRNLQIIFDPVNLLDESNYQEYPAIFKEFVEILGPDIATIHAKDFKIENGKLLSCACGTGQMDYEFLLRYIKEHKPHIHVRGYKSI